MINKIKILIIFLLSIPLLGNSQNKKLEPLSKKEQRKERPTYIGITMGLGSSNFRDFATSPLIYKGAPKYVSMSRLKSDSQNESNIGLSYSFGKYNNSFNNQTAISNVKTISFFYSRLFELNKFSSERLNIKIGGLFNTAANIRINESLANNGFGFEITPTLFGSIKITKDVSRKGDKNKKILFSKHKLKQRTRKLSFTLNIGLINSSYRNGFAYAGLSDIINEEKLFVDYQFKTFSGFRMSSSLDYTIYLKNKNKIQFSYLWDAYKTGGNFNKLEIAQHILKFTFLFNTNNK